MDEIEIKILEINKDQLIIKLLEFGAEQTFDGKLINIYLDTKDDQLRAKKQSFRLRKQGEKTILTHKQRKSNEKTKISEELEVEVSSLETMLKILRYLGIEQKASDHKHRTSFKVDDIHVDIDTYPGIPTFLEIEGPNEECVLNWVEKLGFKKEEIKTWGRSELMEHYALT